MSHIELVRRGWVLEVTLNKPKVNAIDRAMSQVMGRAFALLRDDPDLWCAILASAADRIFSAGWDLKALNQGDMATNLDQFGPALKWPWTRLEAPELTQELRDRMVDGCNAIAGTRHFAKTAATRDREIVAVLKAIRDARSG